MQALPPPAHTQASPNATPSTCIHPTHTHTLHPSPPTHHPCTTLPADTRYSAAGFVAVSAVFLPWMFTFMIGGPSVVGQSVYDKLDATGYNYLNLGSLG